MSTVTATEEFTELDSVVVRFSGDSGDGMQLTGTQFTNASAIASTLGDEAAAKALKDNKA